MSEHLCIVRNNQCLVHVVCHMLANECASHLLDFIAKVLIGIQLLKYGLGAGMTSTNADSVGLEDYNDYSRQGKR
jgi:hypothetical protein